MSIKYYINDAGVKCVDLNVDETLTVDIKGWSRIFQYANRDLVIREKERLRLYDVETNKCVAVYDEELDKRLNNKQAIRRKNKDGSKV